MDLEFIEPMITWVPSGVLWVHSTYIWLDTRNCVEKIISDCVYQYLIIYVILNTQTVQMK